MPRTMWVMLLISLVLVSMAGCQARPATTPAASPPAAAPPAGKTTWSGNYATNIQPIFDQKCVSCHGPSRAENGLRLDSYEGVMKGTQFGPIVNPGQPSSSALVSVIRGTADPSIQMPHGGQRLTDQEVANIVLWIEAGAPPAR